MRIGSRRSALALTQAGAVARALDAETELVGIRTADAGAGDKERFVAGIDRALLDGEVDLAVHSAKDLPAERPDGVRLIAVPARAQPADCFCARRDDAGPGSPGALGDLPAGALVGTASLRRRSQLLAMRPDLVVTELRGNVDTRLRLVAERGLAGAVLARAGLERLERADAIDFELPLRVMTPAPGQGCLAVEAREDDERAAELGRAITDPAALVELTAERAATAAFGADCETPIGVHAVLGAEGLAVEGYVGSGDGSRWVRDAVEGGPDQPAELGKALAERMLAGGGAEILAEARAEGA